ncbi:MAG: GNAT family protein, partial [Bacillota bacterium]|nr:GNAT family protein [Bacillota bacterium]
MLKGSSVMLRPARRDDLDILLRWANDAETTRWLLIDPPMTRAAESSWLEYMLTSVTDRLFIIYTAGGTPVGTIALGQISSKHRKARVGIAIFEKASRNRGFGTEAMELVLDYSFNTLKLHRVELDVFEDNAAAIRSYKKCGFVSEGIVRECYVKNGRFITAILMSILEHEWKGARGRDQKIPSSPAKRKGLGERQILNGGFNPPTAAAAK